MGPTIMIMGGRIIRIAHIPISQIRLKTITPPIGCQENGFLFDEDNMR